MPLLTPPLPLLSIHLLVLIIIGMDKFMFISTTPDSQSKLLKFFNWNVLKCFDLFTVYYLPLSGYSKKLLSMLSVYDVIEKQ